MTARETKDDKMPGLSLELNKLADHMERLQPYATLRNETHNQHEKLLIQEAATIKY